MATEFKYPRRKIEVRVDGQQYTWSPKDPEKITWDGGYLSGVTPNHFVLRFMVHIYELEKTHG